MPPTSGASLSSFGAHKAVAGRRYLLASEFQRLDPETWEWVERRCTAVGLSCGRDFNLVRVSEIASALALLDYADFETAPFPALRRSWRMDLTTERVTFRDYSRSTNPPILHRKELLLPAEHPDRPQLEALTRDAEALGLFDNPTAIGFRAQWQALIASRGYFLVGYRLAPLANATPGEDLVASCHDQDLSIHRQLTALSRSTLSAPMQALLRHELIRPGIEVFDYGCGKGDDLRALQTLGIEASGWDPHYRPDGTRQAADVVNLGFVINVIEQFDERIEALQQAFTLCREVLAVAVMLEVNRDPRQPVYRDGYRTSRATFQKYYSQSELQLFVEEVLGSEAHSVGPGVVFAFKAQAAEHRYLLGLKGNRTRAHRAILRERQLPAPRAHVSRPARTAEVNHLLDRLWEISLTLGREPVEEEFREFERIRQEFGSLRRALRQCFAEHDQSLLKVAAEDRKADILVAMALRAFNHKRQFSERNPEFRRDIKVLFGTLRRAEREALDLLFSVKESEVINAAAQRASELSLGWLEPDESLQVHTSYIKELPPVLRIYIACALSLYGDAGAADLVKVHIRTGKLTLTTYDDFVGHGLPRLLFRAKVRMREQKIDLFEYDARSAPFLFRKSRYINEEFPGYAEQLALEEQLEHLGLLNFTDYGPPAAEFARALADLRWQVEGRLARRTTSCPDIEDLCGRFFTYRQLIECGATWERLRPMNRPLRAESYDALRDLTRYILDPVVEYFGMVMLTYCYAGPVLSKEIGRGIEPRRDQHAACELNSRGRSICARGGAAIDFYVADESMLEVARWVIAQTPFDRLYYYGDNRPIHVSYGPEHSQAIYVIQEVRGHRVPKAVTSL
jgi:DNA phosphorothioation-associated putative methyltransferase